MLTPDRGDTVKTHLDPPPTQQGPSHSRLNTAHGHTPTPASQRPTQGGCGDYQQRTTSGSLRETSPTNRRCRSMKWNMLGALLFSVCFASQSFGYGLLDAMLGCGCGCDACDKQSCCEKSCGACDPGCGCEDPGCGCADPCCGSDPCCGADAGCDSCGKSNCCCKRECL